MLTNDYDPFYNVRKGGPKEKRIRRVELMGEHKPKPVYYVRVSQQSDSDRYLSDEDLRIEYSQFGEISDIYRPLGLDKTPKEFAFVGFFSPKHVEAAIAMAHQHLTVDGVEVTVEEAKSWMLELYPKQ